MNHQKINAPLYTSSPVVRSEDHESPLGAKEEQSLDISKVIAFFQRKWRSITLIFLFSLALAAIYLLVTPAQYTATSLLMLDTRRLQLLQQQSLLSELSFDAPAVESQLEVLKSEAIALSVINKLDLVNDPEYSGGAKSLLGSLISTIRGNETSRNEPPLASVRQQPVQQALRSFSNNLSVQRIGRSYVISISFQSLDASKASRIANAVGEAYIQDQLQVRYNATKQATDWLKERITELRHDAESADHLTLEFRNKNSLTDIGGKLLSEQQLTEMNSRLVSAKAQTAEAKARLDRILDISKRGIEDAAVGDSLQNTVLNRLQQQYIDAAKREAGFSSRYGSDHVAALNLRKEMQQIQDVSKTEMNRILESYKSEFEIARSREQTLQESLDQLTAASVGIRDAQVRLRWLETSANAYRTLHDTYLNRLLEATQQESFPTTEARLITEAATAEKTYPKTSLVLGIVGLIGLAFGCAFAFAREVLDRTFRTGPQVEQALGIQYLGTMPTVLDLPMPPPTGSVPQKGPRTITGNLGIAHQVVRASFSGFSETIRRIKVAADTSAVMGNCKVIGIVSALPGEGKSTVACNLAQLMAHSGQHALLIDCDLRTPCLSSQLTPDAKQGILEVLEDVAQLSDTVWRDSITGLDFLPTVLKAPVAHTSTLLGSHRMAKILDLARTKYDYIVIDLPPLAPLIDAEAVAHNVDAFVLVIEWGQTLPEEITEALGLARAVHYKLLGTVLNKANEVKLGKLEVCSSSQVSRRSL